MELRPASAPSGRGPAADALRMSGAFSTAGSIAGSLADTQRQDEMLEQQDEYFRVVIRVRPPLDRELDSPVWQNVVSVPNDTQICLHEIIPELNAGDRASGTSQVVNMHTFTFDHVYDQDASQPNVYMRTARASVMSALQGYNATILAYGPTGTGKTYTMEGSRWEDGHGGIIPRSMDDIFHHISQWKSPQSKYQVRASYLQIYNEVISDLLKPDRSHLVIREDKKRGVFVEGLSEWLCRSPDEVQTLMEHGSAARATAQTGANDASSRSHAVFMIVVEHSEVIGQTAEPITSDGGPGQRVHTGRLNLVDLAGSERPRITGATGQRLEETKKINQSLSALGNVISALTERRARSHVPYRDSKLTRLLEDSLGGNCRTTMMAMVSPAAEAFGESLSTLKFAQRAKGVLNTPQVNEDLDQRTLIRRYEAEIRRLRSELADRTREPNSRSLQHDMDAHDTTEMQNALAEQEGRIRSEYAGRLAGMEKERVSVEEDKAQVGRYKQLLLKQREIMIALTQRLHERDETIIGLQAEIDARDQRVSELQERLDRQVVRIAAAEKALQASSRVNMGNGPLSPRQPQPVSVQPALKEPPNSPTMLQSAWSAPTDFADIPRYLPESKLGDSIGASERGSHAPDPVEVGFGNSESFNGSCCSAAAPQLLSADDKVVELTSLLDTQRQENHRMKLELENLQDAMVPRHTSGASVASAMASSMASDTSVSTAAHAPAPPLRTFAPAPSPGLAGPNSCGGGLSTASAAAAAAAAAAKEAAEVARRSGSPMPCSRDGPPGTPDVLRNGSTPRGRRSPSQDRGGVGGRPRASSLRPAEKLPGTPLLSGPAPSAPSTPNGRSSSAGLGNARLAASLSSSSLAGASTSASGCAGMGLNLEALRRSASAAFPPRGPGAQGPALSASGPGPVRATAFAGGASAAAAASNAAARLRPQLRPSSRPPSPGPSPSLGAGTPGGSFSCLGASATSLREEAQRSVDALLARRRAEIRAAAVAKAGMTVE
eukprot:TRINITY_DN6943_c0_g1_i1.p1 TRINITY_DN6943_c0_g1~~TRINITY_DN6943_c0_g1_i1.p1  ORF type:complete len:1033 (+),score=204.50 TRINITY_DN6943_c0_g1_i1:90-3101(+)